MAAHQQQQVAVDACDSSDALTNQLQAVTKHTDTLSVDCRHDDLLIDSCRRSLHQPLSAAQQLAEDRQAASAASEQYDLPALPESLILHILSFLSDSCLAWSGKMVCKAACHKFQEYTSIDPSFGDVPEECVLEFLQQQHAQDPYVQMCLALCAAEQGNLTRLQFLHQSGGAWDASVCFAAASRGDLAMLQWVRGQQPPCPWNEHICRAAAGVGHLQMLQWMRAQDPPCSWDANTCESAAAVGHLEMLQWLTAQDPPCPWDADTCAAAAAGGHLNILQWLRAQEPPCPWSARTCSSAAGGGHLDVLKWLRAQDPPCDWCESTCCAAADHRHSEVLQWLRAQEPPCPWSRYGEVGHATSYDMRSI